MLSFPFMKPFLWSEILPLFNPFEKETTRAMEVVRNFEHDVRDWEKLVYKQEKLMTDYHANVCCICGEANPILFNVDFSNVVRTVSHKGSFHKPTFIASPLIITFEGQSAIIELMKEGLIDLYCASTHVPFQSWIGGEGDQKSLLLTAAHAIGDHCCPRNMGFAGTDMPMIKKYETFFHDLLKSAKQITTVAEANENFVFMGAEEEMHKARPLIHVYQKSCAGYMDAASRADKSFFLSIAKKAQVASAAYH